jgi:hypothetical protein
MVYIRCSIRERKTQKHTDVDSTGDSEERPIEREAAKAECKGKRKAEQVMDGIFMLGYNISKIIEVTQERKKEREKMTEAQVEISRLNLEDCKGAKGGWTGAKRIKFARSL